MNYDIHISGLDEVKSNLKKESSIMQQSIEKALKLIALDAETLAMQGAPVDTGRLKNSMTHKVTKSLAIIGTNVKYAVYLELKGKHKGWFLRVFNKVNPRAAQIFKKECKR